MKINYGCIKSELDGSEKIFKPNNLNIPNKYSYEKILPDVINQGNLPICVPCSISSFIDWDLNISKHQNIYKNKIDVNNCFKSILTKNGTQIKQALNYLKHNGIIVNDNNYKIFAYYIIPSLMVAKIAIIMNGPLIAGLPVYNSNRVDFWNGKLLEGYHAVSLIGYNENGFILRNSWGKDYGYNGYSILNYSDFNKIIELWTIN